MRFTVIAAIIAAALLVAVPAQAQDRRAGIERAKAQGMDIDPRAERYMAQAPVGSCANDPTQAKCPRAERVVFTGAAAATSIKARARGAQAEACRLRTNYPSPYKYQGQAWMKGEQFCIAYPPVVYHELYGALYKWYNAKRYLMASRLSTGGSPGNWLFVTVRYDCTTHAVWRTWEAESVGYSWAYGTIWAGTNFRRDPMYCG